MRRIILYDQVLAWKVSSDEEQADRGVAAITNFTSESPFGNFIEPSELNISDLYDGL